jgi:hypothetical protein
MEDFGYKFQNFRNNNKDIIKSILILFAVFVFVIIVIKIFSIKKEYVIENVPLVKGVTPIKVYSTQTNNDAKSELTIYNIIDNTNDDTDIEIKKSETPKSIITNDSFLLEQELLARKINDVIDYDESESDLNIKIVNKKSTTNYDELKKLGNAKLIEYVKKNRNVKPAEVRVQIMSLKDRNLLLKYWEKINKNNLLNGKNYYIEKTTNNMGLFHRLQIGDFDDRKNAENFCKNYVKEFSLDKNNCLVIN